MNFSIFILIILGLAPSTVASGADDPVFEYTDAIERSSKVLGVDRKRSFERCVRGWDERKEQRAHLFWLAKNWRYLSEDPIVFIEVGNSGFGRYDFIYVKGYSLVSSLGPEKMVSGSLKNSIEIIFLDAEYDSGRASSSESYDDDCFFITAISRGESKTFAVYGLPESPLGTLLKDVLREAK